MPTLHIRNIPDELYNRLHTLAQIKQRSLSAQVILLLNKALENEANEHEQVQILDNIRRRQFTPPASAPDSVEMLREARER